MKNFVQPGDNVPVVAPYAVTSGQGLLDGIEFSVASTDIANGASGIGVRRGVFDLAKAAVAPVRKTLAYWDNTARLVTNTSNSGANTKIGYFLQAALVGDATGRVVLVPSI